MKNVNGGPTHARLRGPRGRIRRRSWRVLSAVGVLFAMLSVLVVPAASAQTGGPRVTITPTSGPIGTIITAQVSNCSIPPPDLSGNRFARVDFAFVNGTPAETVEFTPGSDGTATVRIRASDKPIHRTDTRARVNVWRCGGDPEAFGTAPFTVIRTQPRFSDVPANHPHRQGIEWLVSQGITSGCAPRLFCPGDSVTRGQMATFLQRALELPDGSVTQFSDVPANHTHAKGIGAVARAGITTGCGPGRYCPNETVSRAQMATFLQRALDLPAGSVAQFRDVPANHTHARGIGAVARAGITTGCATGLYCPADNVSRGQMAMFLMRALS
jgi:hypothetical protein